MKSLKTSTSFVLATAVFLWVAEIVLAVHEPFTSNIYQLLYIMEAEGQSSNIGGCRGAGLRRNNPEKSNLEKSEASLDKDNVHLDIVVLPEWSR